MDPELLMLLEALKSIRLEKDEILREEHSTQSKALPLLKKEDPDREGVDITVGGTKFKAKLQQNKAPEMWDLERLIPYLKDKGVWERVLTEILDGAKLEAEIRAGNLSARELTKFKVKGDAPRPFIRFDEVKRRIIVRRKRRR